MTQPSSALDPRFSDPTAVASPWEATSALLRDAQLYWLSTVRADGRPHVTPLVGLWQAESFVFVTGTGEQKFRNLQAGAAVVVTTGNNRWDDGADVVVEGLARRITDTDELTAAADDFLAKYGEAWRFEVSGRGFGSPGGEAWVLRVAPDRVIEFAKAPHGQTTYRWA